MLCKSARHTAVRLPLYYSSTVLHRQERAFSVIIISFCHARLRNCKITKIIVSQTGKLAKHIISYRKGAEIKAHFNVCRFTVDFLVFLWIFSANIFNHNENIFIATITRLFSPIKQTARSSI